MLRTRVKFGWLFFCLLMVCLASPGGALAQDSPPDKPKQNPQTDSGSPQTATQEEPAESDPVTMFPHSESSHYWVSGQANIIFQWHPSFPAKYSGPNSLHPFAENATSKVFTLYLGYELTKTTEVFLDVEEANGHGLSEALGIAGFTNLDVVRNPQLSHAPYIARAMIRQVIPLSDERVTSERGPLALATSLPARRLEIRFGKFSMVDFFDLNSWGQDSHLQFMNWTVDNDGAYDYAANTRGYTDGVILEYDDHWFTARFAEALMPKVANGIFLDADVTRARAENLEFTASGSRFFHRPGAVRLLAYLNHANMGNYEEAIRDFEANPVAPPDITATRRQGRHKYGFGLNFEQELTSKIGAFGRLGWSDGRNESFAYTEVDRALEAGVFFKGEWWNRKNDRAGAVFSLNGIVAAHQEYLALGGKGFLLGDGALTSGHEKIFEGFYTAHVWRGAFFTFDVQHVNNPGYNKDRGPVVVPGARVHLDF
ncbi:MAG TPA: carbohydrate porin [Candidatus Limnocylindrales bacterium]|nr:carbohydrate porin [Candidatus Limnocylindrales bacterium]